jgi:thiazole synthase
LKGNLSFMDDFILGGRNFSSRLILGSGKYPLKMMKEVVEAGDPDIVTLAIRRANKEGRENILDYIPKGKTLLPNTSGARNAQEALTIAKLARQLGCGDFIKIEVITDSKYLMPDNEETILATKLMAAEGFIPLPYISPDLVVARKLVEAGAAAVMPLAAPIGSNKGLVTKELLMMIIAEIELPVIVDAGLGLPSHACMAMELGADAVMINTAVATSDDPPAMARAFALAVKAGRGAWLAGPGRIGTSEASSPLSGFLGDQNG